MAATGGFVFWKGMDAYLDTSFVLTHGVEPSKCQIQIPPDISIELFGTLTLQFGKVVINFPECRGDFVDSHVNEDGLEVWTITILDRRWKWHAGGNQISGYYNTRDGKTIKSNTLKDARALMKLCLDALGETRYDISHVPTNIYPEIEWDYEKPVEALAKLADSLNMRVVYRPLSNTVAILKDGEGRKLFQGDALSYAATYDPQEQPDELRFAGGIPLWEMDLELEAVAQDADLTWKPLNDVSYAPKVPGESIANSKLVNRWYNYNVQLGNLVSDVTVSTVSGETSLKEFAKQNVYRKYRIKTPIQVPKPLPGVNPNNFKITDLDLILPLRRERLAFFKTGDGKEHAKPAVVWGHFSHTENVTKNNVASSSGLKDKSLFDGSPPKNLTYTKGWSLDSETGIVTFNDPVYLYESAKKRLKVGSSSMAKPVFWPATLWLRTAFGIRAKETRAWLRWEIFRRMTGRRFSTKPYYVVRNDVTLAYIVGPKDKVISPTHSGEKEYQQAATFYLDEQQRKYEVRDPVTLTYPGWRAEDPDGAIKQITWTLTERGCTTTLSRNREDPVLGYSYNEQRLFQQTKDRLARANRGRNK